jgi:penicillin-binding protein 1A
MKKVHSGLTGKSFASTRPSGVVAVRICRDSGLLPDEFCKIDPRGDRTYTEYFVKGTAPAKTCKTHVSANICKESELIATEFCPDVEEKVFITRPNWETNESWKRAKDAKYMLTIKDTCTIHLTAPDITKPVITLKGEANIILNINDTYIEDGATAIDDKDRRYNKQNNKNRYSRYNNCRYI